MNTKSERWEKWIRPQWNSRWDDVVIVNEQPVEKPRFVLWVDGERALYDGEMMGLSSLDFIDLENETSFQVRVDSPDGAKRIVKKVTGCVALGLEELDDDGEYHEWYDEAGNDIEGEDE